MHLSRSLEYSIIVSFCQADIFDSDKRMFSAVDYFFIEEDGGRFKVRGRGGEFCFVVIVSFVLGNDAF